MSQSIEQAIRDANDALNEGDIDRFLSFHTEDAVLHIPGRSPFAGDHQGQDALRQLVTSQIQSGTRSEIHDLLVSDGHAVMLSVDRGTIAGQEIEDRTVLVFHFRDGQISEIWFSPWDQYRFDELAAAAI